MHENYKKTNFPNVTNPRAASSSLAATREFIILVVPPLDLVNIFCLNSCVSKQLHSKSISSLVKRFFTKIKPCFLKTKLSESFSFTIKYTIQDLKVSCQRHLWLLSFDRALSVIWMYLHNLEERNALILKYGRDLLQVYQLYFIYTRYIQIDK